MRPLSERLKEVFLTFFPLGFYTFGGPQASIAILLDTFVTKKAWISDQAFTELFAICNALPGPPSVQLGFTIALLRGGVPAGIFAFFSYCLPGALVMGSLAYAISLLGTSSGNALPFYVLYIERSLAAVAIALIAIAAKQLSYKLLHDSTCISIAAVAIVLVINFTSVPWLIPLLMAVSGLTTFIEAELPTWTKKYYKGGKKNTITEETPLEFITSDSTAIPVTTATTTTSSLQTDAAAPETSSSSPTPENTDPPINNTIKDETNLTPNDTNDKQHTFVSYGIRTALILLAITVILIILSAILRTQNINQPINIFSTFYFVGAIIFGGGPVVIPLLYSYIVSIPDPWLSSTEFLMGFAIINIMPGPNYNFAAFCGALAYRMNGGTMFVGAFLAWIAVFLPGLLIQSAILPIWSKYRDLSVLKKVFKGLNSAAVGLLIAAVYILWMKAIALPGSGVTNLGEYTGWTGVMVLAFVAMDTFKIQPWWVVGGGAVVGILTWVAEGKPTK